VKKYFEICISGDVNAENFACNATVEALDHAIGLRRVGFGRAPYNLDFLTSVLKIIGGEASPTICQHMRDVEGGRLFAPLLGTRLR
jgi:hypothetical protein